jgi:hypothetical protein
LAGVPICHACRWRNRGIFQVKNFLIAFRKDFLIIFVCFKVPVKDRVTVMQNKSFIFSALIVVLILVLFSSYTHRLHLRIDRLNSEIRGNLRVIDSLNSAIIAGETRQDSLLQIRQKLSTRQKKIIGELKNGSYNRREKLRLLLAYLGYLDSMLAVVPSPGSESAVPAGKK